MSTAIRHWSFASSSQLAFGWGAVRELPHLVRRLESRRALVVTDPVIARLPCCDIVCSVLRTNGVEPVLFTDGIPEPSLETAAQAAALAQDCQPELIVGLGGGSNLDVAKITALIAQHGGSPQDYFGFDKVPGPILPLVAIPTTAGTGSEVSHSAVLTDTLHAIKVSTQSRYLRPLLAIVDPELTLSCPRKVTADSGIDALTHAVEAYVATRSADLAIPLDQPFAYEGKNPLGDLFAEKAIRLIGRSLVKAVQNPLDRQAREEMALAATLAGLAFSNSGVALVHAMEYPLGGEVHCTHGEGNGLLLPHVMRYLLPVRPQEMAEIGGFLGVDTTGMSTPAAAEAAIAAVDQIRQQIGVPGQLRELHVTADHLAGFSAKAAATTRLMLLTARHPTEAEILEIYRQAF